MTLADRAASFAAAFPKRASSGAALTVAGGRLHGVWMGGQDFRNKSKLYGSFPPSFLPCVFGLFPDARRILHLFSGSLTSAQVDEAWAKVWPCTEVHFNSEGQRVGSLQEAVASRGVSRASAPNIGGRWVLPPFQVRCDNGLHPEAKKAQPDVIGDAEEFSRRLSLGSVAMGFDLVIADPPYAVEDQRRYWTESGSPGVFKPLRKQKVLEECARIVKPGGHVVWLDCVWPQHSKKVFRTVGLIALFRSTLHRVRAITILERV